MDHKNWLDIVDGLAAAPFLQNGWQHVLGSIASATGSRSAQLIGFGTGSSPFFNCMADSETDRVGDFLANGGGSPEINPRLRVGLNIPTMKVLTDADVMSAAERKRHPFYNDVLPSSGTAFFCATSLLRERDMTVGLAVLRRPQEGEIQFDQRQLFGSIAHHARAAFRTHLMLEDQGALLLAGALEAACLSAFICDRAGYVKAMTPSAESMLADGSYLKLHRGRLAATLYKSSTALSESISRAAVGLPTLVHPLASAILVRDLEGGCLGLDIVPLPRQETFMSLEPRVVVIARGRLRARADTMGLLKVAYTLTESEAAIALLMAEGKGPERIAQVRGASTGTVRIQIKGIFSKLGVHSQIELVAKLQPLL